VAGPADRRWSWIEVDLGAVAHNVGALKSLTRPGTLFMAVVKAEGYGHGAPEVAQAALDAGADRLGVATVDEGIRLRRAGITAPVQVLCEAPVTAVPALMRYGLRPTLYSSEFAAALSRAAVSAGSDVPFHLKVNTGMNRIGVDWTDAAAFAETLRDLRGIVLEGVFTHFATADVPGDWDFERQLERFLRVVGELRERGIDPGIVHAANSPATILHPEAHLGMVRCGIAIYGLHPCEATRARIDLRAAMSVKARVTQVRRVPMGEGVSYGLTWRAASPTVVATLPLGYADGVRRGLSGELRVLLGGVACRQIGRVAMDQLMVEVPRGAEVRVGDEAVLVGRQGSAVLTLDEQAALLDTINYEVACGYGARLSRRYVPADAPST
jgi:alanine racemase